MKKYFVVFYTSDTFISDKSRLPIESWDITKAIAMAADVKGRFNNAPYAFYFVTHERGDDELDSRETQRSNTFYLGGRRITLQEIMDRHDHRDNILLANMRTNGWSHVIETNYSGHMAPRDNDVILNITS
jgi:hypothetical protein